jgi:hypothetical protein
LAWPIIAAVMLLVIIGLFLVKKEAKQLGVSIKERLLLKKNNSKTMGYFYWGSFYRVSTFWNLGKFDSFISTTSWLGDS